MRRRAKRSSTPALLRDGGGALAGNEQAKGEALTALVPVTWQEVDPYELNQLLLIYMREYDLIEREDKTISEIQQAERLGMTRQRWEHFRIHASSWRISDSCPAKAAAAAAALREPSRSAATFVKTTEGKQHANVSITTEVIRVTLVGQSASEVRRTIQAEGHQNDQGHTFPLAKTGAISTSRIRRRRAQDVADTTDTYAWQGRFAEFIHHQTSVRLKPSDYSLRS